jgi:N6-adenosine-specific RNA methylase IME4
VETVQLVLREVKRGEISLAEQAPVLVAIIGRLTDPVELREVKSFLRARALVEFVARRLRTSVAEHNAQLKLDMRTEHRLGEVLRDMVRRRGRYSSDRGRLPEEITPYESSLCQRIARLRWEDIDRLIDLATARNDKANRSRIIRQLGLERARQRNLRLIEQCPPLDDVPKVFRTIVADPPWPHSEDELHANLFGEGEPYETMTFPAIEALPVAQKADKKCHLYLWITNHTLPRGFAIMEKWGFRYITCLTWCKPSIGIGTYFRGTTEHVLFGIKGRQPLLYNDVATHFAADRQGPHSTKPREFYEMVKRCSPGPRLEMFARGRGHDGFYPWGAEVKPSDEEKARKALDSNDRDALDR